MAARRLSLLDSNFLQLETPTMPMHVAALMLFEQPEGSDENFAREVVERFRACQVYTNPWNYRLKRSGRFQFRPLLQEVHDIDMEYHVRHLALPRPGGERELGQLIARLHSQRLDQGKPLWEVHVIEGLENRRFAVYLKIHHALVDGHSATILLSRGLSTDPAAKGQLPWWALGRRNPPRLSRGARPERTLPGPAAIGKAVREAMRVWAGGGDSAAVSLRSAPRTIFNGRLNSQRRLATHAEPLARISRIAKAADASLNDVVLALSGTVLREYLVTHDALPRNALTAMIPVSMHEAGSQAIENNISMIFASLGTHIADDRTRLETVKASARAAKDRLRTLPDGTAALFTATTLAPVIGQIVSPLSGRTRPLFNVVVSNVRGPAEALYLYGARLANLYPVSVPFHGAALNITCFSIGGQLNFALTACRDSVPHMQQMAVALGEAVARYERIYCSSEDESSGETLDSGRVARRRAAAG